MNLFDQALDVPINILPQDGEVNYYGEVMSLTESDYYLRVLMSEVDWQHDQAIIFGKCIETKRKVAWYADQPFYYTYSKVTKCAQPWLASLQALKVMVEQKTGENYNSCLLNLYHNGNESMAWHSDAEKDLKVNGAIASLSFGARRKFSFKHKETKEVVSLELKEGSLLVMKGETQQHWLHCLPRTNKVRNERISLTFRTIQQ